MQLGMFGDHRVLQPSLSTNHAIANGRLVLTQEGTTIQLDGLGTMAISKEWATAHDRSYSPSALIEEDVVDQIETMLRFAADLLEKIDPRHRLEEIAVVAFQESGGYLGWTTRAEHGRDSRIASFSGSSESSPVHLTPLTRARAALTHQARGIAEDLMVLIRRQVRG